MKYFSQIKLSTKNIFEKKKKTLSWNVTTLISHTHEIQLAYKGNNKTHV